MRHTVALSFAILLALSAASVRAAGAEPVGSDRVDMLQIETLLSGLGYWITKVDGVTDASTYHAIMAFQKVEGRKRTGKISSADMEVLQFSRRPTGKFVTGTTHVEIDVTRQVLFLVKPSGEVQLILPVSTGNEQRYFDQGKWQVAHTPRGQFKIERKINGVRHASLGSLYYPNYFHAGVAIHGSNLVPPGPASHGCVRIPRFADRAFASLVTVGMEVFVYD